MANSDSTPVRGEQRYLTILAVLLVAVILTITWVSIRKSRSDSYELLRIQGVAFTESLVTAAENAILAEDFTDILAQRHYHDLVAAMFYVTPEVPDDQSLLNLCMSYDLEAVVVFDTSGTPTRSLWTRTTRRTIPEFLSEEVRNLLANPQENFLLLTAEDEEMGMTLNYYAELSNRQDGVIVLVTDASIFSEALREISIDALSQRMASERGIEYILHQTDTGFVFMSRRMTGLSTIEEDEFLKKALESDTVVSRELIVQNRPVLEMVRPLASELYPFGVLRVGLSLEGYKEVSRGFDVQMIILSSALLALLLSVIAWLASRRRRKALRREYAEFRSVTDEIFRQMNTGVAVLDNGSKIVFANDAFVELFQRNIEIGAGFATTVPELGDFLESIPDWGHAGETEVTVGSGKGQKVLLVACSRIQRAKGGASLALVAYDVTRLKEYERTVARKERLSEMGHLAAGVAHEIRNPLNAIAIAAQRLAGEFAPSENRDVYLEMTDQIRAETKRLNEIVTRFLALTRKEKQSSTKLKLAGLLDETVSLFAHDAEANGIRLRIEVAEDVSVQVGRDQFKQMLMNLLVNSKEAMKGEPREILIEAKPEGRLVRLKVTDSGPGIPEEIQDKVFAPYYTTKDAGTGLGLPTVQRIVEEWGGSVRLVAAEQGASVEVTIPIAE